MEKRYKPALATWLLGIVMAFLSVFSSAAFSNENNTPINLTPITQNGTPPSWRSSGVLVRIENKVFSWGGYEQCFTPGCTQGFPTTLKKFTLQQDSNPITWTDVTPAGGPPAGRTYHSMAVWKDPAHVSHIIVYGGLIFQPDFSVFASYGDMWDYNESANTWSLKTPAPGSPTPGNRFGSSFQIVGQKGYLFGGVKDNGNFNLVESNDLWEYNFSTNTWRELIPNDFVENPVNQPGTRYRANFDYSLAMDSIVLFGGDRLVLPGGEDKPHRHDTWLLHLTATPYWEKKSEEVDPVVDPVSAVVLTKHVVAFGDLEPQNSSERCCSGPPSDPARFCDDAVKNIFKSNNIDANNPHYTKYVNVNGTPSIPFNPVKRAAYVQILDKLYLTGGYFLDCSAGLNNGVVKKNTQLWTLKISDLEGQNLQKSKVKAKQK